MLIYFILFSEWLWADYMLYDYFKEQFLQRTTELGQEKLAYEKEVLRNVSESTLRRCKKQKADRGCEYFNKGEISFLDEIREQQTNKSVRRIVDNILNAVKTIKLNNPKIQKTINKLQLQIKEHFTIMQRTKIRMHNKSHI